MSSGQNRPPINPSARTLEAAAHGMLGLQRIPFSRAPLQKFWARLAIPCTVIFVAGLFLMGSISILTRMQYNAAIKEKDPTRMKQMSMLPHRAAFKQIEEFVDELMHIPDVCWSGQASSQFQADQCSEFWNSLAMDGILASLPFLMVGVFLLWAFDMVSKIYLKVRRQIGKGQAVFSAPLVSGGRMRNDLFGWFFCFQSWVVQLPNKNTIRVYVPMREAMPIPGAQITVYGGDRRWGAVRFFGVHFTPHVAVVKGQS